MLVIAHRGSSGQAPENTMASFRLAAEAGADMIELDVRLTADGALAVIHDRRLERTTDGRGPVRRRTARSLAALDAGGWFSRRFAGERVPLLEEVLEELPRSIGINIEVKTDGEPHWRSRMAPAVVEAVRRHGHGRTLLVSSFNHPLLRRIRALDASVPTGALAMPLRDVVLRRPSSHARRLAVSAFICSRSRLRKRHVVNAHACGLRVYVYGVNTARDLMRPRHFGVDGVITDYPDRMLRLLGRKPVRHSSLHPL
ncbi:MAG TPA: glycerophosphodiester phosphodiesterase family protein [Bacteroidota bacterium]